MKTDEFYDFAREAIDCCFINDFQIIWKWAPHCRFQKWDRVLWHDIEFVCIKTHRSGKEFDHKYWRCQ